MGIRKIVKITAQAQQDQLMDNLTSKAIHGVFMQTSKQNSRDFKLTHGWLRLRKQWAETEALVIAVQDGVIMTRAYQARVLKKDVNPMCRKCHKRPETIGHILAHCQGYNWTLHKERHDQVLRILYFHLCRVMGHRLIRRWEPIPPAQENDQVRFQWDPSILTDRMLEHRRPDVVLALKEK